MRTLLKILLFPVSLVLTLVVHVACFLVDSISGLLNIISFLLFLGGMVMVGFAIHDGGKYDSWQTAIIILIVSFVVSPYGLPKIAAWLVLKLDDLNDFIKTI